MSSRDRFDVKVEYESAFNGYHTLIVDNAIVNYFSTYITVQLGDDLDIIPINGGNIRRIKCTKRKR